MSKNETPAGSAGGATVAPTSGATFPPKLRVHALAKLLGVTSREVIATLADLSIEVRSAQSSVTRELAEQVAEALLPPEDTGRPEAEERAAQATGTEETTASGSQDASGGDAVGALAPVFAPPQAVFLPPQPAAARPESRPAKPRREEPQEREEPRAQDEPVVEQPPAADQATDEDEDGGGRRRRRRGRRGRGRGRGGQDGDGDGPRDQEADEEAAEQPGSAEDGVQEKDQQRDQAAEAGESEAESGEGEGSRRRRRRRRRKGSSDDETGLREDDPPNTVVHVRETKAPKQESSDDEVRAVRGSTRLEAKRQRRRDGREAGRRRTPVLSEAEFLARREAVEREMVVRERGDRTQIAVLEDGVLVEHFVASANSGSIVGNVYLGRVQNVLPSMEAAFVDIGRGRNAVLYAGEVDWDAAGLEGKARRIEQALSTGDSVLVQVTKEPLGHKGARLTTQISLPGRFLVYVPSGGATGISRKLPDTERKRLKEILRRIVPEESGVIIRTASEGTSEEALDRDVRRLQAQWQVIKDKAETVRSSAPQLLYEEPDLLVKVVRDLFTEDFSGLTVQGGQAWDTIQSYVEHVAPDLVGRLKRHVGAVDVFTEHRVDEQLAKGLDRKVWLPSGGYLVIDRTEAMTVVDVNTGKFTGSGGNLEETVTRNNLEAVEEIVRQLRLRDIGGIIVIDFIDMVLESNRDLVLRRLTECLGRDRTRHQVAEVTSLGLVQMTRKRVGTGLLEAYSTTCEHCRGRGLLVSTEPVGVGGGNGHQHGNGGQNGAAASAGNAGGGSGRRARQRNKGGQGLEQVAEATLNGAPDKAASPDAEEPGQREETKPEAKPVEEQRPKEARSGGRRRASRPAASAQPAAEPAQPPADQPASAPRVEEVPPAREAGEEPAVAERAREEQREEKPARSEKPASRRRTGERRAATRAAGAAASSAEPVAVVTTTTDSANSSNAVDSGARRNGHVESHDGGEDQLVTAGRPRARSGRRRAASRPAGPPGGTDA